MDPNEIILQLEKNKSTSQKKARKKKAKDEAAVPAKKTAADYMISSRPTQSNLDQMDEDVAADFYVSKVVSFLEQHQSEQTGFKEDEIMNMCNIKQSDWVKYKKLIRQHKHVTYSTGLYKYRGSFEINDRNDLLDTLLKRHHVFKSEVEKCYPTASDDIQQLIEDDELCEFPSGTAKEKVLFYYDPDYKKHRACDSLIQLWNSIEIESSTDGIADHLQREHGTPLTMVELFADPEDSFSQQQTKKRKRRGTHSSNMHMREDVTSAEPTSTE